MLSDVQIRDAVQSGEIDLDPYDEDQLNPASYDLTLAPHVRCATISTAPLDVKQILPGYTYSKIIHPEEGLVINPGQFMLATTCERIRMGRQLAARIEGKSSLGRIGLAVHITAGFFDPGWDGEATLEIINHLPRPIILRRGMRIAQIAFHRMDGSPSRGYGARGHYQGQVGPTESKYEMS